MASLVSASTGFDIHQHPSFTNAVDAVLNLQVMPSMRAVMTAGPALERDNIAGYNCCYLPIDSREAFDEAMLILMNGCGVGFSVERQFINKLPEVPERLFDAETTIMVRDSKEGWAKALRLLIAMLYAGEVPKWDTTKVRPKGERLKTFGGRASGPGPLEELFRFIVATFKNAAGRRLTSLECHDIMCKIGDVIVSGGVRRSALLSLSNLSDDRMRHAKSGAWWEQNGQRALANNSVAFTEKPDVGAFMREWLSLYDSKSGERGMFNREAARAQVEKIGRREVDWDWGTNPCSEIILRPYQFCNLSEVVCRATDTVEMLAEKVKIAALFGTWQASLTNFPYLRKVWTRNTEQERLLGVSLTGIYDCALLNDHTSKELPDILEHLKQVAINTNAEMADELGIPRAAAITCIKPSGTVSSLVGTSSGIHPRHHRFYIRRVRNDFKDPLTKFMIDSGVPWEPDVTKPKDIAVFSFPQRAPDGAKVREDVSPLDHLNLWKLYQDHWCEHKPSITVSVREHEWPTVGAWVWEHFDQMSGVAFLPYDGGTYQQAPYEAVSEGKYNDLRAAMPHEVDVDFDRCKEVDDDAIAPMGELSCAAGGCELR
jgi:ribonucleoside-diphosphate reductase alpha chain